MKIIADKNIPFLKGIIEHLGDVAYLSGEAFTKDAIKDADVLVVRTVTYFGRELLEGSKVKLICSATIGFDHIDTDYCAQNNIVWKNAPGCNSGSVQQYIVSSLICIARKKKFELKHKTIGIVGVGNVGDKVARACLSLGLRVLLCDPPRQRNEQDSSIFVDLETIKREADIITFHTPLTKEGADQTFHLGNATFFATLAKKPIIINSARGAIIDTIAIKNALKMGTVSGAVIDCWENEPMVDLEYLHLVDIATPHIAGYSADGKANATRMSLETIANFYGLSKGQIPAIEIPEPDNKVINCSLLEIEDILLSTYSPYRDMDPLIAKPEIFTNLRSNYPLRREYLAYVFEGVNARVYQVLKNFISNNQ